VAGYEVCFHSVSSTADVFVERDRVCRSPCDCNRNRQVPLALPSSSAVKNKRRRVPASPTCHSPVQLCVLQLLVEPFTACDHHDGELRFLSTPLAFDAPVGGFCWNIAIMFGVEKREWCGYPIVKKNEDTFIR